MKELGYDHAPGINHGAEFRNRETGFHSNDIELEFNRLKRWLRQRYGSLRLGGGSVELEDMNSQSEKDFFKDYRWDDLDLCEYAFYSNVGTSMHSVMQAFVHYNGSSCQAVPM